MSSFREKRIGEILLERGAVTEEQLEKVLKTHVAKNKQVHVLIRADKETMHLFVANVLSICKFVGVKETRMMIETLH